MVSPWAAGAGTSSSRRSSPIPEAEDRYVEAVVKLVDESDYDGLDLDWEYPDTERRSRASSGSSALRAGLRRDRQAARAADGADDGRLVQPRHAAVAQHGVPAGDDGLGQRHDLRLRRRLDRLRGPPLALFASSKVPAAAGRSIEATMLYLVEDRKIPADRLAVGLPLYGPGFRRRRALRLDQGRPGVRIPQGDCQPHRLLERGRLDAVWDDETKNPWLIAPDGSAVIGYDDAESIA